MGTNALALPRVDRRRGLALAVGGMVIISLDAPMIRVADVDGFDVVFWVGALTTASTLALRALRRRRDATGVRAPARADWRGPVLVAGGLQALTTLQYVVAVQETAIANVGAITAASPLAAALFSRLLLRERATRWVWQAIAASGAGIAVILAGSGGGGNRRGDLFALGAITTYGLLVTVLRRHPDVDRLAVVAASGAFMAAGAAWPATGDGYDAATWLALLAMGVLIGPAARVLLALAPRHLPATEVALLAPVESLLVALWGYLAFSEWPGSHTWIGGALVLAAVAWGVWPRGARAGRSGAA